MRDFLYSEVANFYNEQNFPSNPELAIEVGEQLCVQLLEPLHATFGRIAIRSAYRSCNVNQLGNQKNHNCSRNEINYGRHIWDHLDSEGCKGATACIVIPWFTDKYSNGVDWKSLAFWIHDNLPYSEMEFFDGKGLCSFNLSWNERPKRTISSWIGGKRKIDPDSFNRPEYYQGFPLLLRDI